MRQLQLDIEPYLDAQISDFVAPSWLPVIDHVRQLHLGLIKQFYVYGEAGIGKTHLLSAICNSYLDVGKSAIKVSLLDLLHAPVEAIQSLEMYDLVALDDIEVINGIFHWQKAIFDLINLNQQTTGQLIFSSRFAPIELKLQLPDLQSRLAQSVSVRIPNGQHLVDREALLAEVMNKRGLKMDQQIIDYLLQYGPKQPHSLLQMLDRLQQLFKGGTGKDLSNKRKKQLFALIDQYSQE